MDRTEAADPDVKLIIQTDAVMEFVLPSGQRIVYPPGLHRIRSWPGYAIIDLLNACWPAKSTRGKQGAGQ